MTSHFAITLPCLTVALATALQLQLQYVEEYRAQRSQTQSVN